MYPLALLILGFSQLLQVSHCGVLIWGSESIQLPSLKQFNNEDFDLLKSYMRRPKVVVFQGDPMQISSELQEFLKNKYTAYVPNSSLNLDEVIELKGDPNSNLKLIEDTLNNCSREYDNILALIISDHEAAPRVKREVQTLEEGSTEDPTETITTNDNYNYEPATGPVLYKAFTKGTPSEVAMFYSSRTPVLKINDTSYTLGKATVETVDDRGEKYRQLSVAIPMEFGDKVTLRFKFMWSGGYWSLNTIILLDMSSRRFNLTGKGNILASINFSYHCSGTAIFKDEESDVELMLFDIQAQPDATIVRFNDAYDCVDFTTVPIWSGIFVVSMLMIGLAIGLGALNSIKTMDKFDNSKTKQLNLTTAE